MMQLTKSPKTFKTGYIIVTGIALGLAIFGCAMLIQESRQKRPEQRDVTNIVIGIGIACAGGLVMLITVLALVISKPA